MHDFNYNCLKKVQKILELPTFIIQLYMHCNTTAFVSRNQVWKERQGNFPTEWQSWFISISQINFSGNMDSKNYWCRTVFITSAAELQWRKQKGEALRPHFVWPNSFKGMFLQIFRKWQCKWTTVPTVMFSWNLCITSKQQTLHQHYSTLL